MLKIKAAVATCKANRDKEDLGAAILLHQANMEVHPLPQASMEARIPLLNNRLRKAVNNMAIKDSLVRNLVVNLKIASLTNNWSLRFRKH